MTPENLTDILNAVPYPLIAIGPRERIRVLNAAAQEMFGPDARGRHYFTVLRQPALLEAIEETFQTGRARDARFQGSESGRELCWNVRCSPLGRVPELGSGSELRQEMPSRMGLETGPALGAGPELGSESGSELGSGSGSGDAQDARPEHAPNPRFSWGIRRGLARAVRGDGAVSDAERARKRDDGDDLSGGILLTFSDVSEQEASSQMRRDFVANVSHELRTPLTALSGFIETLAGPAREDQDARDRFLGIMARETLRMNRLVQDLLSLSRVEGEERFRPADTVDLVAVLQSVNQVMRPQAEDSDTLLSLHAPEGPLMVSGDQDQLTQVFTNLVENALKYGGAGKPVRVEVSRDGWDPLMKAQSVSVAVADQGDGIHAEHIPRLTERFYRIDNHRSREMGGTGLGLAIVKHIVIRHRGRLRIESRGPDAENLGPDTQNGGTGSCFTVQLRLTPAEAATEAGG